MKHLIYKNIKNHKNKKILYLYKIKIKWEIFQSVIVKIVILKIIKE